MTIAATPPVFDRSTPLFEVLRTPEGHAVVSRYLPELVGSSVLHTLHGYPIGLVVDTESRFDDDPAARDALLSEIARIAPAVAGHSQVNPPRSPSLDYEDESVPTGSAAVSTPRTTTLYRRFELELSGPRHGNPFVDVSLHATVEGPDGAHRVPGFYDGDGTYRVRYLPLAEGDHTLVTESNARSLDGIVVRFSVGGALQNDHGPVRVANTFHFAHADGTRHVPLGTTSYAWTHQPESVQATTLATLAAAPFTKIRMGLFPKSYLFNENDPEIYPFERLDDGSFDLERPDVEYWARLDSRIDELDDLGIQADLILFHAYDRWGFSTMPAAADDRYVRYAVARLAAHANVWWSLANEYDLLFEKSESDWERFAGIIGEDDPTGHLLSIHNCRAFYDYSRDWVTHASIQRQDLYKTSEMVTDWRAAWGKPVVVDECVYEGNIDQGWGNISGQELTRRFWEGALRGGYVGHGETYAHHDDRLWWSKGGTLHGSSPERIAFLAGIIAEGPAAGLEPIPLDWDAVRAGVEGAYYLYYFGFGRPTYRRFLLDPAAEYTIDVIDTWNMTVERLDGTYRGRFRIDLPGREFIAVRLIAV
ncbi:DUF5605 domain-containing protein [Marisediminicola sp. LYQ134]|uniref:DUF5605 domain-containing protein n=1 Tax=unclassified Marisediminicola TaxID=2618316 RepID=UPI003982F8E8